MHNLSFFLKAFLRPGRAVSDVMDGGSSAMSVGLVLLISAAFFATVNYRLYTAYELPATAAVEQQAQSPAASAESLPIVGDKFFFYNSFAPEAAIRPLVTVSVFYLSLVVFLTCLLTSVGNYGDVIARDYGTLATSALMAWAASHLPFALLGGLFLVLGLAPPAFFALWVASTLLFTYFMVFVLRTALGASFRVAVPVTLVGGVAFALAHFVFAYIPPAFFLPLLVVYAFVYFRGNVDGRFKEFKKSVLPRQSFKRLLHEVAVNPSNADAHVQLAHVYRFRHQNALAVEHLKKALTIDPREIDANYEIGRIARLNNELQKALDHFAVVVDQDDTHSLNEIWREIGATYLAANMYSEARSALETFRERRPFDAEGLYYLGKAIKGEGAADKARELFQQAVESVKVSPAYRRRYIQRWGELAEKEI
jgi:tetratricopeptide (TPR) repeat protein